MGSPRSAAHYNVGSWTPMLDTDRKPLVGIEGKAGVRSKKEDGTYFGADFIRMQPGSRFPLHTHAGDHVLYVLAGFGYIHIDGEDIAVTAGHLVHIPAEQPHSVWVAQDSQLGPLIFLAIGHPHKPVHSLNRMRRVEYPADHPVEGDFGTIPP